jgi:hypothetical protein
MLTLTNFLLQDANFVATVSALFDLDDRNVV